MTAIPTEEAPEPLQSATYLYDGDGNLVKSVVDSTLGHTTTTYFPGKHYSVEEKGGALKVQKHYAAGGTIIAVRTVTAEADTLQWMISDQLGSTSTTANADGTWNSDIRYTAFGEIRLKSGVTASGYRYTGQLDMQSSIGLDYYVARFYDPQLARFAQADTINPDPKNPLNFDRYAYVHNNPIRNNDPTGHICKQYVGTFCVAFSNDTWTPPNRTTTKQPSYLETIKQKSSPNSPYMEGWKNFDSALEILSNPNATLGDRYIAGNYVSAWGGGHGAIVVGGTYLLWQAIAGTAGACSVNPACLDRAGQVVDDAGEVAKQTLDDLIANGSSTKLTENEAIFRIPQSANEALNYFGKSINTDLVHANTELTKFWADSPLGGRVGFRIFSSSTPAFPSTPVLDFSRIPGYIQQIKFHFFGGG